MAKTVAQWADDVYGWVVVVSEVAQVASMAMNAAAISVQESIDELREAYPDYFSEDDESTEAPVDEEPVHFETVSVFNDDEPTRAEKIEAIKAYRRKRNLSTTMWDASDIRDDVVDRVYAFVIGEEVRNHAAKQRLQNNTDGNRFGPL